MGAGVGLDDGLIELGERAEREGRRTRAAAGKCQPDQDIIGGDRIGAARSERVFGATADRLIVRVADAKRRASR
jgi:hypothetical protein